MASERAAYLKAYLVAYRQTKKAQIRRQRRAYYQENRQRELERARDYRERKRKPPTDGTAGGPGAGNEPARTIDLS